MNYFFGYLAAVIGFTTLWPQIVKTFTTKSVRDLSLSMWILLLATNVSWFVHSLIIKDLPLMLANVVSGSATIIMIVMKLKFEKKIDK